MYDIVHPDSWKPIMHGLSRRTILGRVIIVVHYSDPPGTILMEWKPGGIASP